jgi:NAD(P)H-dependent flavin oxidoreductase YrpB (nitropropane dioxygenase family)
MLPSLRFGELTAPVPIVQGGMSVGISLAGLASAVANEGGVGVIGTAGISKFKLHPGLDFIGSENLALRNEIKKARGLIHGRGLLGVNIMVALSNFAELARTAIEEKIDCIFAGAGLPLNLPSLASDHMHTKLVPIISSARAGHLIAKLWVKRFNYVPDAFVVEGPLAGGHLGFKLEQINDPAYALEHLVPEVLAMARELEQAYGKPIPIIAGGGIYTGGEALDYFRMGVSGVQMATRFVTTHECDAAAEFKQAYLDTRPDDIVIIQSPVGLPGRAIRNDFIDKVKAGQRMPFSCPYHCIITCDWSQSPYCIALALLNAQKGQFANGFAFCGSNAYRADKIVSVKEVIDAIKAEYEEAALAAGPGHLPAGPRSARGSPGPSAPSAG